MNLADMIVRNAAFTPDKPALSFYGQTWCYADFAARIIALAGAMQSQLGVRRGDRVAILALNHPDYLTLLYACARLGAMLVPLNWRLALPEQLFILGDAGAKVLFVAQEFDAVCAALPGVAMVGVDHTPANGVSLANLLAAGGNGV